MATQTEGTNRAECETSGLGAGQPATPALLKQHWRRWFALVELLVRQGASKSARVDPREYNLQHSRLIETCRALARDPGNPKRELHQQVELLVAPWLSVIALEQADREILNDLLGRARQIEQQIVGPRSGFAVRRGIQFLLLFLVIAGGAFLVVQTADWILLPFLEWTEGWILWMRLAVKRLNAAVWLITGGIVVILLASYLVSRGARN